jgi:hypothetical protein
METPRLEPLKPTMMTVQFTCKNLDFDLNQIHDMKLTGNIIRAKTNECMIVNENYVLPPPKVKSTRGRKKKIKTNKRCPGGVFNSQIQFEMVNPRNPYKPYVIKCFKSGNIQPTGQVDPDYQNIIPSINELIAFMNDTLGMSPPAYLDRIVPFMRNYLSVFKEENVVMDCARLAAFIKDELIVNPSYKNDMQNQIRDMFPETIMRVVDQFLPVNYFGINSVHYNPEVYIGVIIKINRPVHNSVNKKDYDKGVTLKILPSKKINIDGCRVVSEIENVYLWVDHLAQIGVEKRFMIKYRADPVAPISIQLPQELPDGGQRMVIDLDID